ncbi:MAG: Na+/H+ antiporter NhaC family protein [Acholeplasmataceae bacterium]
MALLVAAGVFVQGLKSIGIITHLQDVMTTANVPGFTLPLILVLLSAVIVILSGSGTALFYAMVPLMAPPALAAGISAYAVTVPMGLAGNLLRAVSPVSAVVVIVSGTTKQTPFNIVKRTAVPMVAGVVFMFVLSMLFFL